MSPDAAHEAMLKLKGVCQSESDMDEFSARVTAIVLEYFRRRKEGDS